MPADEAWISYPHSQLMLYFSALITPGQCDLWPHNLLPLQGVAYALSAIANFAIALMLLSLIRQRVDVPFKDIFRLLMVLMVLCGSTHFLALWRGWFPQDWRLELVQLCIGGLSIYTAIALGRMLPQVLVFSRPKALIEQQRQLQNEITERDHLTQQLQASEARWKFAIDISGDGVWDWSFYDQRVFFSPRWKAMLGYAEDDINHSLQAWQQRIHPDDLAHTEARLRRHFQGETASYQNEYRLRCKDGSYKWILARGQVMTWTPDRQPLRMMGIHTDISDRKQTERQAQLYMAQLQASNRELESFADSVSHDLRAPLRAIDGFSQALREDYGDRLDASAHNYFERIRTNIVRMNTLIDDLLNLSRVTRVELRWVTVNLSQMVQDLAAELQARDPERQVEFAIAPDVCVAGDRTLLQVVMNNLVRNAWKFTRHHPTARIEFNHYAQGEDWVYFVRDDGAGFDMKDASKLFGVFQRLHDLDDFPGTGMGLAIVQRAIHRHGGHIWAAAAVEQGATFYFTVAQSRGYLGSCLLPTRTRSDRMTPLPNSAIESRSVQPC